MRFGWAPARSAGAGMAIASLLGLVSLLEGCAAPVAIAVAAGSVAVSANDPRSTATQLDDQAIEFKVTSEAGTRYGNDIHLNVTSYNGVVLLTGEAPSTVIQDEITKLAKAQDNVKLVQNEMVIAPVTDLGARTNDTFITSKVKTRLLQDDQFGAIYIKVVTERSVVYLMGMLARPIGESAAQTAATTDGVAKVVKVFEYTG